MLRAADLRSLIPITQREMGSRLSIGQQVVRVIIERQSTAYRAVIIFRDQPDAYTFALDRGGVRTWVKIDTLVKFMEEQFQGLDGVELYLRSSPLSESD